MTIHRDLDHLEHAGMMREVRGGATIDAGMQFESDFRLRERQDGAAKQRMAQAALDLIEPGMSVMLKDGFIAALLGAALVAKRPLTVITNNAAIIDKLRGEAGVALIALGGIYNAKFNGFFGVVTEESIERLRADITFVSAPAVSGVHAFHMDDAVVRTKRVMMASAERTCLLLNHQRFGITALHILSKLVKFDHIISDDVPAPEDTAALARAGIKLKISRT